LNIIKETLSFYGHRFNEKYVYGVKFVTKDNQDMFGATVGNEYVFDDSDTKPFDSLVRHTAGLWSMGCIKHVIYDDQIKHNKGCCMTRSLLVQYNIEDVIPVWTELKGIKLKRVEIGRI